MILDKITPGIQRASELEIQNRETILGNMANVPREELLLNLGLFVEPRMMSRILFLNHVYQKILGIQGIVMDLGTRWGNSAVVMQTLRSIYEPYNFQRKVVAFDTFSGLSGCTEKDGELGNKDGYFSVHQDYQMHLENLMLAHENLHPLDHMKKFEIVIGDVRKTVPDYIKQNPETLISLAFFDLDLYSPTLEVLKTIQPRLTKGSILIFDELNYSSCPGETLALLECFDLNQYKVERFPFCSRVSYIQL